MTRKVHPIVLAKLFGDPGSAGFPSIYACECGGPVDAQTDTVQPTETSSLSPTALAWPMAMKHFRSIAEVDGSHRLARMSATKVGV